MAYRSDGGSESQHSNTPALQHSPANGGFTLIEILLVVVITAITSVMALAAFSTGFQSAQLRTASKAVVMSHKYARSMAVLDQKQMMLVVDTKARQLEIASLAGLTGEQDRDKFLDSRTARAADQLIDGREAAAEPAEGASAPSAPIASDFVRELPKDIQIESVQSLREGQVQEGVYWILYYPNGMSDGFTITLVDKSGKRAKVTVDPISGTPEVENE